jgi:oligopeptide/dipeptide ABC transporter ATP-binding protein
VELGAPEDMVHNSMHPYTRALLAAIPKLDPSDEIQLLAMGEAPSAVDVPPGCRFNPRCPLATSICLTSEPALEDHGGGHMAACHHSDLVSSINSNAVGRANQFDARSTGAAADERTNSSR